MVFANFLKDFFIFLHLFEKFVVILHRKIEMSMKRFFFFGVIALVVATGRVSAAEELDIHSLHRLSNTMEHSEFVKMAIRHDALTRSITVQEWYAELGVVSDDTLNMLLLPTLYDLIAKDYYERRLPQRDSIYQAWTAFHAQDENILPRLYLHLKARSYIPTDTLYALYEAEKNRWESGYILSRIHEYDRPYFYGLLKEYLETYPTSPFVPNIRYAQQRCEQLAVYYSYESRLSTTDSVVIDYSNSNAHEIVFELYRLPKRLPKKGKLGAALEKVDSVRVTTDKEWIFVEQEKQCRMAPLPFGRYLVYARLPEDSLQRPASALKDDEIEQNAFFVSDLRVFGLNENVFNKTRPWYVVMDVHTGQPIYRAKVKQARIAHRTNRNGETKFRKDGYYYRHLFMQYKDDRYHEPFLYGGLYPAEEKSGQLKLLPNATIFRPGDTLRLAIVGNGRVRYQSTLITNASLWVRVSNYSGYSLDTMLTLDEDGTANFSLPFTGDMKRGAYNLTVLRNDWKIGKIAASGYCSVTLEDYRLPTFSVAIDDSCRVMQRDRLQPITGKAMRTNGLPLSGAEVLTTIRMWDKGYQVSYLDTTLTDQAGVFRVQLSDRAAERAQKCDMLFITSTVTAPDGETRYAHIYTMLHSDQPTDQPDPVRIAGVPQDSLLWVPADSMLINGREVTMRLGVPRACWVYCVVSSRECLLSHTWRQLEAGMHSYSFTLPDAPDDYLDVRFVTTGPKGQHVDCHRHLPGVSPTELHIVPVTMRDYLTPDASETWTFRLTDAKGQAVQGRMVLAMTDKALEELQSSVWTNRALVRWTVPYTSISEPLYGSHSEQAGSHVPAMKNGFRFFPPLLYAPYRVDSTKLLVVQGKIVDTNGEPVIGASITVQGTKTGTISDYEGEFFLAVQPGAMLECSFVGMHTVVLPASSNLYIVMEEDEEALNEVVVTGYGVAGVQVRGVGSLRAKANTVYEVETLGIAEEEEEDVSYLVVAQDGNSATDSKPVAESDMSLPLRDGDTRLALYLPTLQTDEQGEVHVHFVTPPDNTEWMIQAFAWSRNASADYYSRTLMARRTLMLRLQLPRFLRHGDVISLPCVVSNTADTVRQTTVRVVIRDAQTDSVLLSHTEAVLVPASGSHTLFVPYTASCKADIVVTATVEDAQGTTDGEKRLLSILPLDEPVRECVPFYMRAQDSVVTLQLPKAAESENRQVELLLCTNPLAYIAAQLPTEVDSSAVTVTQLAHNLYALSLRNKLAQEFPSFIEPVDCSFLVTELKKYQRNNGAFSWLKDYRSGASYYLTLRVLTLLGELQEAGALDSRLNYTQRQAVRYIDREMQNREKEYRKTHHDSLPDYTAYAQYAYVRVLCPEAQDEDTRRIVSSILDALYAHLDSKELTSWPLLALTFERAGQHERALAMINGLRRYATMDAAHGMYWNNLPDRWWWYRQADVQASFLLAFSTIDPQPNELDALRQWLILNNRTTEWGQSSLNAYVTYVLMHSVPVGTPAEAPVQTIALPDSTVSYTLRRETDGPMWGALMSSYIAPANQLRPFATKAIGITRAYERADEAAKPDAPLTKGDRIRVTLTITTDREMDQVIVTDRRPALLEPVGASSYAWQEGAFYYREIRNTEERLYIEHLRRGTTVLTYECYVTATGITLAGLAHISSELAPEFTAHTAAETLQAE